MKKIIITFKTYRSVYFLNSNLFISRQKSNEVIARLVFSLIFFLPLFSSIDLQAQTLDSLLIFEPSKRSVSASNEELIDLTLKVVNKSANILPGIINITPENSMNLVSKNKIAISVKPGDSVFVPVKVFVTKRTVSGPSHLIKFILADANNNVIMASETNVQVSAKRNVNMVSLISSILLEASTDSIRIPIRISNPGNTAQKVTMINQFPSVFQNELFHNTLEFTIQPATDTLITIAKPVTRKMFLSDGFDITFTGLYANGDVFGMSYVRVQSGRSDRAYRDPLQDDSYNANIISVSSQGMFSQNQAYLVNGRGNLELSSGSLGYSLDYTKWKSSYSPAMMRNTWLNYQSDKVGIMAGNIYKNMDINLNGRGASVFLNDTTSHDTYEVGFIDGNSNLFGSGFNSFLPPGSAGWATYSNFKEDYQFSTSFIYEVNPLQNSNNAIFGNNFTVTKLKGFRILANLSAGHATQRDKISVIKPSFASGLNINGTINKLVINSNNYYSSAYYPGIRSGALSFNERITWLRNKSNVWAGFDYNHYAPRTFSNYQLLKPIYSTLRAEIGISGTFLKKTVASVAPAYFKESNNAFQFQGSNNAVQSLEYWNINSSLNYLISNGHYFSMNNETGLYNSTFDDKGRFHLRSNINYKNGIFNLSSTLQFGTFYIGEAVNNYLRNQESPRIISIIPTVRKSFYRNTLRLEAGVAWMNNSYSGNSSFLTGRTEYDLMPKTGIYAAVNHNRFNSYQYSILEVGITQKLSLPKAGAINSDLEVFIYKDMNQNGIFDQGDIREGGHLLYINDAAFISDTEGSVKYKKLPLGNYRISISNIGGWYSPDQFINLEKKKHRIEIPLKRTGTLKGSVVYSFNEFSYEINQNLRGITIVATDENNVRYVSKTNMEGQVVLYLPFGKYSISVDESNLPPEVEVEKNIPQIVLDAETIQNVTIKLIVKPRKIETKKFVSPNKSPNK